MSRLKGKDMELDFVKKGPDVTETDIAAFEQWSHVQLPADYRRYILQWNGATPLRQGHPPDKGLVIRLRWPAPRPRSVSGGALVGRFARLLSRTGCDTSANFHETNGLYYLVEQFRERIPSETLPIARDPGGSLFLLKLEGPQRGSVVYWSRQFDGVPPEEFDPPGVPLGIAAESFEAFLNAIEPEPDDLDEWEAAAS